MGKTYFVDFMYGVNGAPGVEIDPLSLHTDLNGDAIEDISFTDGAGLTFQMPTHAATVNDINLFAGESTSAGNRGGSVVLKGGDNTTGASNPYGGNVTLSGGLGVGSNGEIQIAKQGIATAIDQEVESFALTFYSSGWNGAVGIDSKDSIQSFAVPGASVLSGFRLLNNIGNTYAYLGHFGESGNNPIFLGNATNGATAIGVKLGSFRNLNTPGAKLVSIVNDASGGGTEVAYVDYLGAYHAPDSGIVFDGNTGATSINTSAANNTITVQAGGGTGGTFTSGLFRPGTTGIQSANASTSLIMQSFRSDGAGVEHVRLGTTNAIADTTSTLVSIQNNAVTKISFDLNGNITQNGGKGSWYSASLNDDATISLPNATSGMAMIQVGDNEEYAIIAWASTGVVTLILNSGNVVNSDTDTKFCIFDGGTSVSIRNRLGAAKNVKYQLMY